MDEDDYGYRLPVRRYLNTKKASPNKQIGPWQMPHQIRPLKDYQYLLIYILLNNVYWVYTKGIFPSSGNNSKCQSNKNYSKLHKIQTWSPKSPTQQYYTYIICIFSFLLSEHSQTYFIRCYTNLLLHPQ